MTIDTLKSLQKRVREATGPFYVVDLRRDWNRRPYLSFWRPKNANYAYPLVWAGRYTIDELEPGYHYHLAYESTTIERCPVLCSIIETRSVSPRKGIIDGDTGPVVVNSPATRAWVRRNAFVIPARAVKQTEELVG